MKRARIKAIYTKSQYSKTNNMLNHYLLVVEDGAPCRFQTREAAEQYATSHNYRLPGARWRRNRGGEQ